MNLALTFNTVAVLVVVVIIGVFVGLRIRKKRPRKLKVNKYIEQWKELQQFCRKKDTWPQAVVAADQLLDKALKRRRFKGKRMGERMVSAQRTFTDNDAVWFAHNLCKKILADDTYKLREADVKNALMGFGQALRDIGALPRGRSKDA